MPDPPVDRAGQAPYAAGMEAWVAVLEQIARSTEAVLQDIRADIRDIRIELRTMRTEAKADYRWLLGMMVGASGAILAVMAHGFHWY